jgi:hypothetical protein
LYYALLCPAMPRAIPHSEFAVYAASLHRAESFSLHR